MKRRVMWKYKPTLLILYAAQFLNFINAQNVFQQQFPSSNQQGHAAPSPLAQTVPVQLANAPAPWQQQNPWLQQAALHVARPAPPPPPPGSILPQPPALPPVPSNSGPGVVLPTAAPPSVTMPSIVVQSIRPTAPPRSVAVQSVQNSQSVPPTAPPQTVLIQTSPVPRAQDIKTNEIPNNNGVPQPLPLKQDSLPTPKPIEVLSTTLPTVLPNKLSSESKAIPQLNVLLTTTAQPLAVDLNHTTNRDSMMWTPPPEMDHGLGHGFGNFHGGRQGPKHIPKKLPALKPRQERVYKHNQYPGIANGGDAMIFGNNIEGDVVVVTDTSFTLSQMDLPTFKSILDGPSIKFDESLLSIKPVDQIVVTTTPSTAEKTTTTGQPVSQTNGTTSAPITGSTKGIYQFKHPSEIVATPPSSSNKTFAAHMTGQNQTKVTPLSFNFMANNASAYNNTIDLYMVKNGGSGSIILKDRSLMEMTTELTPRSLNSTDRTTSTPTPTSTSSTTTGTATTPSLRESTLLKATTEQLLSTTPSTTVNSTTRTTPTLTTPSLIQASNQATIQGSNLKTGTTFTTPLSNETTTAQTVTTTMKTTSAQTTPLMTNAGQTTVIPNKHSFDGNTSLKINTTEELRINSTTPAHNSSIHSTTSNTTTPLKTSAGQTTSISTNSTSFNISAMEEPLRTTQSTTTDTTLFPTTIAKSTTVHTTPAANSSTQIKTTQIDITTPPTTINTSTLGQTTMLKTSQANTTPGNNTSSSTKSVETTTPSTDTNETTPTSSSTIISTSSIMTSRTTTPLTTTTTPTATETTTTIETPNTTRNTTTTTTLTTTRTTTPSTVRTITTITTLVTTRTTTTVSTTTATPSTTTSDTTTETSSTEMTSSSESRSNTTEKTTSTTTRKEPDGYNGICPSSKKIRPCTCADHKIRCHVTEDFDIEEMMTYLSDHNKDGHGYFETFELISNRVEKLPDKFFKKLRFNTIKLINCQKLKGFSRHTFKGTEHYVKKFVAVNTSLTSGSTDRGIFSCLKTMENLEEITILNSLIREIPVNAFGDLDKLKTLNISGSFYVRGKVTRIDSRAFELLNNLKYLNLSHNIISQIDSQSFYFVRESDQDLVIDLSHNLLNSHSLERDALCVNGRNTTLNLKYNRYLHFLKKEIFKTFLLNSNQNNSIKLFGNPLECRFENNWILENKFKLKDRITGLDQDFWQKSLESCTT